MSEPTDPSSPQPDAPSEEQVDDRLRWQRPLLLFVLSVTSALWVGGNVKGTWYLPKTIALNILDGWKFAVPLFAILLAHEFGHYFAARYHGVRASLPYFLPMPLSPLGTWGAIIGMPDRISTPRALLDIGAAGPLAGMAVALPVLSLGLHWSQVHPIQPGFIVEGQCLLYMLMKRIIVGPIPAGSDVFLHPTAFAGWAGLFITMINLLPSAQLDGGHIAYALLGKKQDRIANIIYQSLPFLFLANLAHSLLLSRRAGGGEEGDSKALQNGLFWLVWFGILTLIRRFGGVDHPPTDEGHTLDGPRRAIAIFCLVLFVVLFMPQPFTVG